MWRRRRDLGEMLVLSVRSSVAVSAALEPAALSAAASRPQAGQVSVQKA